MGEDHSKNDSSDIDYVPASKSESDSDMDSDNAVSDNSKNNNNSKGDDDSDGNVEETPEDVERAANILDQEKAGDDIPTEPSQSTSREDDCCVDVQDYQSASEDESEDLPGLPTRTMKAPEIYNPMTGKSYVQNSKSTGVDAQKKQTSLQKIEGQKTT